MKRSPTASLKRPFTSSSDQCFENVLHNIDYIRKQNDFRSSPFLHEDIKRPKTFPGFSQPQAERYTSHYEKYLVNSDSDDAFRNLNLNTDKVEIKTVPALPIQLGFLRGKKLPKSRAWRSTLKPPKSLLEDDDLRGSFQARSNQNTHNSGSYDATRMTNPSNYRSEKRSQTEMFLKRLKPIPSMNFQRELIQVNTRLKSGPSPGLYKRRKSPIRFINAKRKLDSQQNVYKTEVPGVKVIDLVEEDKPLAQAISVDQHKARATLKRWEEFLNSKYKLSIETDIAKKLKKRINAVDEFLFDPKHHRSYDCNDRLRLAVYLESLELFYDEILKSDQFEKYRKSLKIIHEHILKSLYVAKAYSVPSLKGQFANEVENERFYYKSPTFNEANNTLHDEYRKLKKERDALDQKASKLENKVYMLERELGKSHHAYMSAEDSIDDEVAAIHALSHLDEASQYRAVEIALNRVRRRPEESKKSIELTLKYEAESQQGLLSILESVARKLPPEKVLDVVTKAIQNKDNVEEKRARPQPSSIQTNDEAKETTKYHIWKDESS